MVFDETGGVRAGVSPERRLKKHFHHTSSLSSPQVSVSRTLPLDLHAVGSALNVTPYLYPDATEWGPFSTIWSVAQRQTSTSSIWIDGTSEVVLVDEYPRLNTDAFNSA
jgi:hypothetical protein